MLLWLHTLHALEQQTSRIKIMIYKLIELIIAELSFMCGDRKHSMEFREDLRTAVKALENIKKYF